LAAEPLPACAAGDANVAPISAMPIAEASVVVRNDVPMSRDLRRRIFCGCTKRVPHCGGTGYRRSRKWTGTPQEPAPGQQPDALNLGEESGNALRPEADNRRNQRKKRSTSASARVRGSGGRLVRKSLP